MRKIIAVIMLFVMSYALLATDKITLAIGEWPPYTSNEDPKGKISEVIVKEAFKQVNIEVEFKYYPWKRAYENVKYGNEAGTFPWIVTEEIKKDFILNKEPIIIQTGVFFHLKKTDFKWNDLNDLKKYKLGVTIGYVEEKEFKEAGLEAEAVASEDLNFKKLLAGRIDACPSEFMTGYYLINKLFSPAQASLFTNNTKPLREIGGYMLISQKIANGKELAEKFDIGLKKLKKSGRYDKIIAEFLIR